MTHLMIDGEPLCGAQIGRVSVHRHLVTCPECADIDDNVGMGEYDSDPMPLLDLDAMTDPYTGATDLDLDLPDMAELEGDAYLAQWDD